MSTDVGGLLDLIRNAILQGEMDSIDAFVASALAAGATAEDLLNGALAPAMTLVGEEYERGERFVPEMLISAEAMKIALVRLQPLLVASGIEPIGTVVIGTVEGDLHDIGKDLVAMMFEGAGLRVINLGAEVPATTFVEAAKTHQADIVALSALLTTTMIHMRDVVDGLMQAGLRDHIMVIVGGAPVSESFARDIGADAYAADGASAVRRVRHLLGIQDSR